MSFVKKKEYQVYNTHFAKNEYQMYNTHDTSTTHPRKPHNTPKETESRKAMLKKNE